MFATLSFQSYLHGDMKNWSAHSGGMRPLDSCPSFVVHFRSNKSSPDLLCPRLRLALTR